MARTKFVQRVPVPEAHAHIDTNAQSRTTQAQSYSEGAGLSGTPEADYPASLQLLHRFATVGGDISDLLEPGQVERIGIDAVRQWETDDSSRQKWKESAQRYLDMAAQETEDRDDEGTGDGLWDNSADIDYPILTTSSQQFAARAGPELIRGDKVVGVKVFTPPQKRPTPGQVLRAEPPQGVQAPQQPATPPQGPQGAPQPQQQAVPPEVQQAAQATQQEAHEALLMDARKAKAQRVSHYLNYLIFYKMDDWEGDTDLLLHQIPITGSAFKKVYMGTSGLCSDYVSALRLTVHNDTKSLYRCPRITEDFEVYPFEIEQRRRAGIYRDVELPKIGQDPEQPRKFIEQHRLDDLDGDGLAEPYVVTVDIDTKTTMRVEPAYTADDIMVRDGRVTRIDGWNAYAGYLFLPDPRGKFYGIGFGRLLDSITDSVDTSINQLLDAGTAEIAGGGFIGSSVRLQGSGQGGAIFFRPGEYQTVGTPGGDLRQAIWERTVPHPSEITLKLLELLLGAAKDIASVKDVVTGNTPATAPVGTTLAVQQQALQVFSAIYKRVYRGFRDEFRLMFKVLKRWGTEREVKEYAELTGGDFRADFAGDGTDIQPVADPSVVTKMQKIAKHQAVMQLAESPVGQASGMTQSGPAQEIARDFLDDLDVDRPDRFFADVPPNSLEIAKTQDISATAQLKEADAKWRVVEAHKEAADTTLAHAKALREVGLAAQDTHAIHQEADRVAQTKSVATLESVQPPPLPEGPINGKPSPVPA